MDKFDFSFPKLRRRRLCFFFEFFVVSLRKEGFVNVLLKIFEKVCGSRLT